MTQRQELLLTLPFLYFGLGDLYALWHHMHASFKIKHFLDSLTSNTG